MSRTDPLAPIRRAAASRTLMAAPSLMEGVERLGFVQIDPMRAPARAQDLILRHRVAGYRAGDLDAAFDSLPLEEDFLINYGYLPRDVAMLMHPRSAKRQLSAAEAALAARLHAHIQGHGPSHPSELVAAFGNAQTRNAWGGASNAVTHLLDAMQYRSRLRVARRERGIRVYETLAPRSPVAAEQRVKALLHVLLRTYAPVSAQGLKLLARMLKGGLPGHDAAIATEVNRLQREAPQIDAGGVAWLWPEGENPKDHTEQEPSGVRLLAPFDPIVWDRQRFEQLHGWAYRFEAYTPAAKRERGHYAMPLLVGSHVLGWANLAARCDQLQAEIGFTQSMASHTHLEREVMAELARFTSFMRVGRLILAVSRHPNSAW